MRFDEAERKIRRTMAADPLGGAVDDDIGTMLKRTDQIASRAERVINYEWDLMSMSNLNQTKKTHMKREEITISTLIGETSAVQNCGSAVKKNSPKPVQE